jgi:hypothetical protein
MNRRLNDAERLPVDYVRVGDFVDVLTGGHIDAYGPVVWASNEILVVVSAAGEVRASRSSCVLRRKGTVAALKASGFTARVWPDGTERDRIRPS